MKSVPIHIETNSYKLRSLVPEDITPPFIGWLNSANVMVGLNLASVQFTQQSFKQFILGFDNYKNYLIGIFTNGALIGFYTMDVNHLHKTGNITAAVMQNTSTKIGVLWGTIDALLDHFFIYCGVEKITARVLENNRKMLFNFLGNPRFVFESRLYKECLGIDGERLDLLLFCAFKNKQDSLKAGQYLG